MSLSGCVFSGQRWIEQEEFNILGEGSIQTLVREFKMNARNMCVVSFILAIIFTCNFASAAVISGTVVSAADQTPIQNVQVTADGASNFLAYTNESGQFEITSITPDNYIIYTTLIGYPRKYHNDTFKYSEAQLIQIEESDVITDINFSLVPEATISGTVTDQAGDPVTNLPISATDFSSGSWYGAAWTNSSGYYIISNLPPGNFRLHNSTNLGQYAREYYNDSTSIENATPVSTVAGQETPNIDFQLEPAVTIIGRVLYPDAAPAEGLEVNCYLLDGTGFPLSITDPNGYYQLKGLGADQTYKIIVDPLEDTDYMTQRMDVEVNLPQTYYPDDIILQSGALTLSGKVMDADNGESIDGVEITYWSEQLETYKSTTSNTNGEFEFSNLPPGIAEIVAKPSVSSGYCWNVSWPNTLFMLQEGQNLQNRFIPIEKGALVTGYFKDTSGSPLSSVDFNFDGINSGGWGTTDTTGMFELRLPAGYFGIKLDRDDNEGMASAVHELTIIDITQNIQTGDITVYSNATGSTIEGAFINTGSFGVDGAFIVGVIDPVMVYDPNTIFPLSPIAETSIDAPGPYQLGPIPNTGQYHVFLGVINQQDNDIFSITIRDVQQNIDPDSIGVDLTYSSQGSTLSGKVVSAGLTPIAGAYVLLENMDNTFAGMAASDSNGNYTFYNVAAGDYKLTLAHKYYTANNVNVSVQEGVSADADLIHAEFRNSPQGPDADGSGVVDQTDFINFTSDWLAEPTNDTDLNDDSIVNLIDWAPLADYWTFRTIWIPGYQLAAHLTMDDNDSTHIVLDSTVFENNGLSTRTTDIISVPGIIDTALDFNGTSDQVYIPNIGPFFSGAFTASAWVKADTFSGQNCVMLLGDYLQTGFRFGFLNNGQPAFWTSQSGGDFGISATATSTGEWHHLAVTYLSTAENSGSVTVYLDGTPVVSGSGAYMAPLDTATLRIGGGAAADFDGVIDDVRIYNKTLTADEIEYIYNDL